MIEREKKMKKLLSSLAMFMLILTGCASQSSDVVEIEFMHSMTQEDRIIIIDELVNKFNEENPDIIVTPIPVSEDSYNEKLVTQGSTGELPAIIQLGTDMTGTMNENEYTNFEANNEVIKNLGEENFYDGVLELAKDETGTNYSLVPADAWVQGIWYNTSAFEENNLEIPNTYDSILTAAEKFNSDTTAGIVLPTDESTFTQQVFSQFALANGANLVDNEGNITFDTPEMIEALEQYQNLSKYSLRGSITIDQVKDSLISGKTNMVLYSTYMFPSLYEAGIHEDFSFAPLLDKEGNPVAFGNPSGYTITSNLTQEEQDAAVKFVSYLGSQEAATTWNLMTVGGGLPAQKSVAQSDEYLSNETVTAMNPLWVELESSLDNMQSFGTIDGKNYSVFGPITNSMVIGKTINDITVHEKEINVTVQEAQEVMGSLKNE